MTSCGYNNNMTCLGFTGFPLAIISGDKSSFGDFTGFRQLHETSIYKSTVQFWQNNLLIFLSYLTVKVAENWPEIHSTLEACWQSQVNYRLCFAIIILQIHG